MKMTQCDLIECGSTRIRSRSVSWNASGSLLGMAGSDGTIRLFCLDATPSASAAATTIPTIPLNGMATSTSVNSALSTNTIAFSNAAGAREVMALSAHAGSADAVQFQPRSDAVLASAASSSRDNAVSLWDVRTAQKQPQQHQSGISGPSLHALSKAHATIPTTTSATASIVSMQWNPVQTNFLAVALSDGHVHVFDTRMLLVQGMSGTHPKTISSTSTTDLSPYTPEICVFDPSGQCLFAGTTAGGGMGYLQAWNWREKFPVAMNNGFLYPAHAGPVYAMAFSNANNKPNANNTSSVPGASGSFLATGGADAVVGLWNVATMTCDRTIGRPQSERTKLIRSLAVSPDNRVLAIATEENAVELVNIPTTSKEQAAHSKANRPSRKPFSLNNPAIDGSSSIGMASFGPRKGLPGAEDIAFHPSATISSGSDSGSYLLACARTDAGPMAGAPVTIMKLTMNL